MALFFSCLVASAFYLFLHRVLVRDFRRFVTHDPKGKVHGNRRQPEAGAFPMAAIVTQISGRNSRKIFRRWRPVVRLHSIREAKNNCAELPAVESDNPAECLLVRVRFRTRMQIGSNRLRESAKLGANLPMPQMPGSYLDLGRWLTRGLRRDANRLCSLPPPLSNFGD